MLSFCIMKILKLLYPEWQSFGVDNRASAGAYTVHKAFSKGNKFVEIDVLQKEKLLVEEGILGRSSIVKNSKQVFDQLHAQHPEKIFMIGGTCGSEIVPVAYLNQFYHQDMTVLWFDAHGDLNTPESSPSGHFHGMVLRLLLGDGDQSLSKFVSCPLSATQVSLVGVRDLDTPEFEYVFEEDITIIPPDDLTDSRSVIAAVERYGASNVYIHLDLDFFNPRDFEGSQCPTPGGLTLNQFVPILFDLNSHYNVVGLSIVEFASTNFDMAAKIQTLFEKSGITGQFR